MQIDRPIGIFDSGVGGTSIWKEIHELLPFENTLFLADSANAPYGNRSEEEIIQLSIKNTKYLINSGCKLIVVACNTATTNAITQLRSSFQIPIIGIEPAIKPAALQTTTKSIGILATRGTLSSALFHATAKEFTKDISVIEIVGNGLVPLIEEGKLQEQQTIKLLKKYMAPMLAANIDHLVLGCSHYPYLIPTLSTLLPRNIKIIDSGLAVARQTKAVLEQHSLLKQDTQKPVLQFFTNGNPSTLQYLLRDYAHNIKIEKKNF